VVGPGISYVFVRVHVRLICVCVCENQIFQPFFVFQIQSLMSAILKLSTKGGDPPTPSKSGTFGKLNFKNSIYEMGV
jgi:hypothetical protein